MTCNVALDIVRNATTSQIVHTMHESTSEPAPKPIAADEEAISSAFEEEDSLAELLEEIHEILESLSALAPNLEDPAPQDIYEKEMPSSKGKATHDIELAARMFPLSAPWLIYRLGNANWRRRRYLKKLHEESSKFPSRVHQRRRKDEAKIENVRPQRDLPTSPQAAASPGRFQISRDTSMLSLNQMTLPSSATSETWESSAGQTIFSGPNSAPGYAMSIETEAHSEDESTSIADWTNTCLVIPPPPVQLQEFNRFICPYCKLEITVGDDLRTDEDWCRHVFSDLEPYLCTFKDCARADKTFSMKYDWIRHELDSHRIRKVWHCESCQDDYTERDVFEKHLSATHKDIFGGMKSSAMSTVSERSSERTPTIETCPLCRLEFEDRTTLQDHLANHLEQFALTSIKCLNTTDGFDADSSSEQFDDNASERRGRLETLNLFVEEQLEYLLPRLQKPPDDDKDETNIDFVGDSDGGDPHGESNRSSDSSNKNVWTSKIASFLNKQPVVRTDHEAKSLPKDSTTKSSQSVVRTHPPPRNDEFEGRDKILEKISTSLSKPGSMCILSGAGGIGKTATVIEYTYRDECPFIFWIQAETSFGTADAYCRIATQLRLAEGDTQDQDKLILNTRKFLETTQERWLLVFDNVDEWSHIKQYIPDDFENTQGSVLLTTRKIDFGREVPSAYLQIELGVLTAEESKRLLLHSIQASQRNEDLTTHPQYELAGKISTLVEHFPLAVSHIAGYVKVSRCTLSEFLELWQERQLSAGNTMNEKPSQTEQTLETVWNIGLRELSSDAVSLLHILAFLDSESIQQDLLVGKHELPSLGFLNSAESVR